MSENTMLDAALDYATRGWPVLALSAGSKIPLKDEKLQPNGVLNASTDPAHIKALWKLYPLANVGIATGEKSFTAIDVDDKQGSVALKEAKLAIPKTRIHKTPRGFHILVQYDPRIHQTAAVLPHVDVRNDGGYIVAPPSIVNGVTYTVHKDGNLGSWGPMAERYERFIYERDKTKQSETEGRPGWVAALLTKGAPLHQRNDSAIRLAGYFRSRGIPQDIAAATMLQFAEKCDPPFDQSELDSVIRSAWRYQPTKPTTYQGNILPAPLMDATSETLRVFRWPEQGIAVRIERLRDTGRRLECWITISTAALGKIYGPIALDLLSTNQRDGLRRALKERDDQDWMAIIQHVSDLVIQSLDPAEELIDLTAHVRSPETPWLLEPFVRRACPTLLYSDGGEGKSTLALALAVMGATGDPVLPGLRRHEPFSTLYLDWESDPDDMQDLMEQICNGANTVVPAGHLVYRRLSGALTDHLEAIQRDVLDNQVQFVIVDSIIAATNADTNEAASARAYFDAMRLLKVASLGITHITKDGRGKPFGSVYYWNLARAVWRLRQEQEQDEPSASIGLFHEKFNRGQKLKPLGWTVTYDDDGIRFGKSDVASMPTVGREASVADQIAMVLRNGAMGLQAIYEELAHLKDDAIRQALNRKTRVPRFINLGEIGWGLIIRDASQSVTKSVTDENVTRRGGLRPPTPPPSQPQHSITQQQLSDASSLEGESSHAAKKKTGVTFFDGVNHGA